MAVMAWKIKQVSNVFEDAKSLQMVTLRASCQLFPNGYCLLPQREKAEHVVHARRLHNHTHTHNLSDNVHTVGQAA